MAKPGDVSTSLLKRSQNPAFRSKTIVRTRIMLTDISQWEAAARAHGEFFVAIRPASTFVEMKGFIDAELTCPSERFQS